MVLVMVTNPVDVLTCFTIEFTGLPWYQVIGAGTLIDSMCLSYELSCSSWLPLRLKSQSRSLCGSFLLGGDWLVVHLFQ